MQSNWRQGALLAIAVALAASASHAQTAPPPKWGPHIDFEGKAGNKRNIGEADVFVPLWQNADTLVFGNVKTRLDDDSSKEGNLGAGVRHMLPSGWNVGGYGYFDRRKTEHDNYFNQVTLGVEALSVNWDFRANSYLPQGRRTKNADALNTAEISGTSVIFRGGEERSLTGFDAEIGWRVPVFDLDAGRALRIYGGAYRFYGEGVNPVQGPRARAELTFDEVPGLWEGSRLTLGAEAQHDGPRGDQVFAVARLRIPLQIFGETRANLTPLDRRMTDPTVRDVDVVSQAGQFSPPETATQLSGGTSFTVLNSGSTAGADLDNVITAAANDTTFILSGTFSTTATVDLTGNKSVMGGDIVVRSPSGRTAVLSTPATISSSDAVATTIQAPGNNTISGLTIVGTDTGGGARAIGLNTGAGNHNILNNTIRMTQTGANGIVGIATDNNTNVLISGNSVTVVGVAGQTATAIGANGTVTNLTLSGNAMSASGGTTNHALNIGNATINTSASTGNVISAGVCTGVPTSGSVSFTDGTTCP